MQLEFKKALVPICIFYFSLFFSFNLVEKYLTLQLRTLGLSLDDAALIGGWLPFTLCPRVFSNPFIWFHSFSFGFIHFHLVSFVFIWFHSISFGFIRFHWVSFFFILFHLVSFSFFSVSFGIHSAAV